MHHDYRRSISVIAALFGIAASAQATTIRVPQDFASIQAAVNTAVDGCEIRVAPGVYSELVDLRGKRIVLTSTGGAAATILDGTGLNWSLVIAQSGETFETVLRGFTLRNSTGASYGSCFGPPSPIGGAVYVWQSALTIEDCTFEGNGAGALAGGAILVEDGSLDVKRSTFLRNGNTDSQGRRAGYGGAIAICGTTGTLAVSNSTFEENGPCGFGGAVLNFFRVATMSDCVFTRNEASHGGGVAAFGTTTIERSTFDANESSHGGGLKLHANHRESGVVRSCRFFDNTSAFGGGINAYAGTGDLSQPAGSIEISNCLAVGNQASFGGGFYVSTAEAGSAVIANSTIVGNSDGVAMSGDGGNDPRMSNCIVRGNTAGQVTSAGGVRFSNVEGGSMTFGNIDADPLFANAGAGDYSLLAGSPSIDTGDDASVPSGTTVDLAGNPRFSDGDGDTSPTVDMGAFEFSGGEPLDCGAGNVNLAGSGGVSDVLIANGSAGGPTRTVTISSGQMLSVSLAAPPAGPAAPRYLLYAWAGAGGNPQTLTAQGSVLGCFVNPTPLHVGVSPQPLFCLGGQGLPAAACAGVATKPSPGTAPWTLSRTVSSPLTITLQGIIRDFGSAHPAGYSVVNALTIVVTP